MLDVLRTALKKWHSWPQWFASFNVFLISLVVGLENGWTSPSLAKLTSANSILPVTEYEASWIASLLNIGRAFGSIGGLICSEYFGSKASLVYNAFIHGISMMCLLYVNSVNWLYASRFIAGFGSGMWNTIFPIYIGEISNPKIRGALVSFITLGMPIGLILGNIIGAYTAMWVFGCFSMIPIVIFLLLFFWFPHTPYYLVLKDRIDGALHSIKWYQRDADTVNEVVSIKDFVEEKQCLKVGDYFREMTRTVNMTAFIKVTIIHLLIQFGGFCTIGYYFEIILTAAQIQFMHPAIIVPAISGVSLIGGVIAIYTCDKFGRKVSLGCGSIGMGLGFILIGVYFQLIDLNFQLDTFQWIPTFIFVIIEFSINLGIDPVLGTIFSEIFSPNIKSLACCLINVLSGLFAFIATQWYQAFVDATAIQYVFYFFGTSTLLLALFTFVCLPETKGKSLQEIQAMLSKKR